MKIKVRYLGMAVDCGEGLEIPLLVNGFWEYSVTEAQARYWNTLSTDEKDRLIHKSGAENKDLRYYLDKKRLRL